MLTAPHIFHENVQPLKKKKTRKVGEDINCILKYPKQKSTEAEGGRLSLLQGPVPWEAV